MFIHKHFTERLLYHLICTEMNWIEIVDIARRFGIIQKGIKQIVSAVQTTDIFSLVIRRKLN